MSLAVVIITYNEEKHIEQAVKSAKKVTQEIIVIDSNSTDNTVDIAKRNGAKIFFRTWDNDYAAQRNFACDKTDAKWLLCIDADEVITDELAHAISIACSKDEENVYGFTISSFAFGKKFRFGPLSPATAYRLYPRLKAKWQGKIHESIASDLAFVKIGGNLFHYTYDSWEQYANKMNRYSTIWAKAALEKGKKASRFTALMRSTAAFLKMFILKGGFLDGSWGLIMCSSYSNYTLMKYLKLFLLIEKNSKK